MMNVTTATPMATRRTRWASVVTSTVSCRARASTSGTRASVPGSSEVHGGGAPAWTRTEHVEPRDVVRVSGPDALTYLQGQVSQDLLPMAVGDRRWTFLLQPTGKIDVLAGVQRTADDEFVFDVDAGWGDALVARLNRFKIRVKVDVEPLPSTGDGARTEARAHRGGLAGDGLGDRARRDDPWPRPGSPTWRSTSARAATPARSWWSGWTHAARRAPRQLRVLDVADGAAPGDPIVVDGVEVGRLTSVAGNRALGYVKRGH